MFGGFIPFTLIDYPGKTASVVFTIGCNFRCPYCHNPELVDETVEKTYTEEEIISFLDTRRDMLDGLVITGGEPTIHEDLIPFMRKVKEMGFLVKLDTNGTDPEMIKKSIVNGLVDYIAMDIKAPLSTYAQNVGRPVNTQAIQASIQLIMDSPVEYEFRTTVIKSLLSPEEIEKIGQDIKGARRYYLQKFISTKILNPQFRKKTTYSDDEFSEIKKTLKKYVTECEIR